MKELHTHGRESTRSHVSDDQQRACRPAHAAFPSSTGDRSLGSLKATMVRIYTAENSKEYTWVFSSSQPPTPTPVVNYIYQHLPLPVIQSVRLLATPWTAACQVPLSMGSSWQQYWSGLSFPSLGDLSDPGIEPGFPELQADSLPPEL